MFSGSPNPLQVSNLTFLRCTFCCPCSCKSELSKGLYQKSTKTSNLCFVQNVIWRVKRRSQRILLEYSAKKIKLFSTHVIRTLWSGESRILMFLAQHELSNFCLHIVLFCQCEPKPIEDPQSEVTRSRFLFTLEINDKHLSQYSPERKVFQMTLEQFFKIFIKTHHIWLHESNV